MWFETDAAFADDFAPAPEAFLVAAMPLAAGLGEPRLAVEGRACPRLRAGLSSAMRVLAHWYPFCREVPVEAQGGWAPLRPRTPPRAAAFVTGGVDSLSVLRENRLAYPLDHPAAIRDGIFLFGWNAQSFDGQVPRPERLRAWGEQRSRLERLGAASGWTLLPVRTNARTFLPSFEFQRDAGFGAGMIAAAHLFARRISEVSYASGGDMTLGPPHGSHPLLDPHASTSAVEVRHAEPTRTRMEKVRTVAAWAEGLEALQVCLAHEVLPPGVANCGRCEKCLRTRLALLALGRLEAAPTFPQGPPRPEDLDRYRPPSDYQVGYAEEIAGLLEARGEGGLAEAVRAAVRRSRRHMRHRAVAKALRRWLGLPGRRRAGRG
jgi:hypothetical protein